MITLERLTTLDGVDFDGFWNDTKEEYAHLGGDLESHKPNMLAMLNHACATQGPWLVSMGSHPDVGQFSLNLSYIKDGIAETHFTLRREHGPMSRGVLNGSKYDAVKAFVDHLKEFGCTGQILRGPSSGRTTQIMFGERFQLLVPEIYSSFELSEEDRNGVPITVCRTYFA